MWVAPTYCCRRPARAALLQGSVAAAPQRKVLGRLASHEAGRAGLQLRLHRGGQEGGSHAIAVSSEGGRGFWLRSIVAHEMPGRLTAWAALLASHSTAPPCMPCTALTPGPSRSPAPGVAAGGA